MWGLSIYIGLGLVVCIAVAVVERFTSAPRSSRAKRAPHERTGGGASLPLPPDLSNWDAWCEFYCEEQDRGLREAATRRYV